MFLSRGKTVYNDNVKDVVQYFDSIGYPMPPYMNPAEYVLDLINTDFDASSETLDELVAKWKDNEYQHHDIVKMET